MRMEVKDTDMDMDEARTYEITVGGFLDGAWSSWLSDLIVATGGEPPITVLCGRLDQTALRGVLNRLWDLNLTLISVRPQARESATDVMGGTNDD